MTTAVPAQRAPSTAPSDALSLLREMVRIRRFEERCVELYSATRIRGFLHLCIGEEAVAVGVNAVLGEQDAVVATYREHGNALARGVSMDAVMAEMFGKVTGCSRGRGGSMHLFDAGTRFYGGNAIVAGGLPLAVGLALADRMLDRERVTACFFGDGAVAEGEFHESLNLAALWRLPVLFCCENNRYAMGTAIERANANVNVALRAASYGLPAWSVDGMDVEAVTGAARHAVDAIRADGGPYFLELQTYRFRAHSMYDPERYRDKAEVEAWKGRDPITHTADALRAAGLLDDGLWASMEQEIDAEIAAAEKSAEAAPVEDLADLLRFVTSDGDGAR
ncbi:MAG: pyruvate dehydrogenase (acetyl-transferring) E1 component subunit alpha [Actinomycetes bacterium]